MGNQGIGESENQGVGESGNQGIGKSGNIEPVRDIGIQSMVSSTTTK